MICSKSMTIFFLEFLFRSKHILRFIHKGKYQDILPKFGTGSRLKSPPQKKQQALLGGGRIGISDEKLAALPFFNVRDGVVNGPCTFGILSEKSSLHISAPIFLSEGVDLEGA